MKRIYIKPEITVIKVEKGNMMTISMPIGTNDPNAGNGGSGAKPNNSWGSVWNVQNADNTWGDSPTTKDIDLSGLDIK